MIILLAIFDVSYVLRFIYSILFASIDYTVFYQISDISLVAFFDLIPLTLILWIHTKNFATIRQDEKYYGAERSSADDIFDGD